MYNILSYCIENNEQPMWYTRMRLGEFDPPEMNPYTNISIDVIQSESHRLLATQAAKMSFVLLKNEKKLTSNQTEIKEGYSKLRHIFFKKDVLLFLTKRINNCFNIKTLFLSVKTERCHLLSVSRSDV